MNNVLLIGHGYWGKIILKNLTSMDEFKETQIFVYDKFLNKSALLDNVEPVTELTENLLSTIDRAFVIVPSTQHFDICQTLLEHKIDVFCEKPLCSNSWQAQQLHDIAVANKCTLFTDWIFTYNDQVNQIRKDYIAGDLGAIKSIRMKRLNNGPERFDVDARWDLASHDVSIIQHILSPELPVAISWRNYRQRPESAQNDSTHGFLDYGSFKAMIDASWEFGEKERGCLFEFEKCFVEWDDSKAHLRYYKDNQSRVLKADPATSPLKNSIQAFLTMTPEEMEQQHQLTINTLKILEK